MKTARCVLRFVAIGLSVAAAACLVIAYWDKLLDFFYNIADKLEDRRCACCDPEFEDFADTEL